MKIFTTSFDPAVFQKYCIRKLALSRRINPKFIAKQKNSLQFIAVVLSISYVTAEIDKFDFGKNRIIEIKKAFAILLFFFSIQLRQTPVLMNDFFPCD